MKREHLIDNLDLLIPISFIAALLYLMYGSMASVKELKAIPHPERAEAYKEFFEQCLSKIPDGPEKTKYNDWDEIVHECASVADEYVDKKFGELNIKYKEKK